VEGENSTGGPQPYQPYEGGDYSYHLPYFQQKNPCHCTCKPCSKSCERWGAIQRQNQASTIRLSKKKLSAKDLTPAQLGPLALRLDLLESFIAVRKSDGND